MGWVRIVKGTLYGLLERKGTFGISKFVYPYGQFYMISWALGLNWIVLWALYQIKGPFSPRQNIEGPCFLNKTME